MICMQVQTGARGTLRHGTLCGKNADKQVRHIQARLEIYSELCFDEPTLTWTHLLPLHRKHTRGKKIDREEFTFYRTRCAAS